MQPPGRSHQRNPVRRIVCVGAGFSGAVIARTLCESLPEVLVTVIDSRPHVAGNCHSKRDESTGVMVHTYGPHIFHTDNISVWEFVCRYATMLPYTNRVKAISNGRVYSMPLNLMTINQVFSKVLNPNEARSFLASLGSQDFPDPQNFEEKALSLMGETLYKTFFYHYTKKQWGLEPKELPASILKRLPVRFDYNDNYYNSRFQGMPRDGYTAMVSNILSHPRISLRLGESFTEADLGSFDHCFYSGSIDEFYGHALGALRYRTLDFETFYADGDFQGNAVINYCDDSKPFTRITEHKHFAPWESHDKTICYQETSRAYKPGDIPYYPLGLPEDLAVFARYRELAHSRAQPITFIGRLGTYRYLDMHQIIAEALAVSHEFLKVCHRNQVPSQHFGYFTDEVL